MADNFIKAAARSLLFRIVKRYIAVNRGAAIRALRRFQTNFPRTPFEAAISESAGELISRLERLERIT